MKQKTRKAVSKRIKVTGGSKKTKKFMIRTGGQGHFNTRERGKVTTNKRRDHELSSTKRRHITRSMPNL